MRSVSVRRAAATAIVFWGVSTQLIAETAQPVRHTEKRAPVVEPTAPIQYPERPQPNLPAKIRRLIITVLGQWEPPHP